MRGQFSENVLMIFVKYPTPGRVKTRLAKTIGNKKAALLHKTFVEAIIKRTASCGFQKVIFYSPHNKEHDTVRWLGNGFHCYPQQGRDLGERLRDAFSFVFDNGAKKAVVIGTDSLFINHNSIRAAFERLKHSQCVIGPCSDGGYYLLGLSCFCREIFRDIHWSSSFVFTQTLDRIKRAGLTVDILPASFDIDTKEDLLLLKEELEKKPYNSAGQLLRLREIIDNVSADTSRR